MTIIVDDPLWQHRDGWWCHLTSDSSLEELHAFAQAIGLPERAFHGDHYDVPAQYRADAIAAGAVPVTSRELVARLRRAGLRLSPAERRRRVGR